jgi:hypothetical protein
MLIRWQIVHFNYLQGERNEYFIIMISTGQGLNLLTEIENIKDYDLL